MKIYYNNFQLSSTKILWWVAARVAVIIGCTSRFRALRVWTHRLCTAKTIIYLVSSGSCRILKCSSRARGYWQFCCRGTRWECGLFLKEACDVVIVSKKIVRFLQNVRTGRCQIKYISSTFSIFDSVFVGNTTFLFVPDTPYIGWSVCPLHSAGLLPISHFSFCRRLPKKRDQALWRRTNQSIKMSKGGLPHLTKNAAGL
jgi:hypothetical protein